jgi:putative flippase GtrA
MAKTRLPDGNTGQPPQTIRHTLLSPPEKVQGQLLRSLFTGGAASLIDWFLYWALINLFGLAYYTAAPISYILAATCNYIFVSTWVFPRGRFSRPAEFGLTLIVSITGLGINQLTIFLLIEQLSFHYMLAKIIATSVVFCWNFTMRRQLIFKG